MIKLLLTLTSLGFFTSCSQYISYLEEKQSPPIKLKEEKKTPLWCPQEVKKKINIIHNDLITIDDIEELRPKYDLPIADLGILLTLYQVVARADATDWNSRVQIHLKSGSGSGNAQKEFHMDFGPLYKLPLYNALLSLEKGGHTKFTLNYWRRYLNSNLKKRVKVQKSLSSFLIQNENELIQLPSIKKRFFRLNKPLQNNETFYRHQLKFPQAHQYQVPRPFSYSIEKEEDNFQCSFDSGLYKKGIFLISDVNDRENAFGIIKDNGDYFFAITKKSYSQFKDSNDRSLFPGESSQSLNPFCTFKKDNSRAVLMSFNSRDSGQLLYHLYNYGVKEASGPQELFKYISYPRHQFLLKPGRLLYESDKGSKTQLRYFLSLDFPVYHINNLGTIFGLWSKEKETTFIPDPRLKMNQSCLPL